MKREIVVALLALIMLLLGAVIVIYSNSTLTGMAAYNGKECPAKDCSIYGTGHDCSEDSCRFACYWVDECKACDADFSCSAVGDEESCNNNPCEKACMWLNGECIDSIEGKYYVHPGFMTSIDYNMNDYAKVGEFVDSVSEACKDEDNIGQCYDALASARTDLVFNRDCEIKDDYFYDIISQYLYCVQSYDFDCTCPVKLPDLDEEKVISLSKEGDATLFAIETMVDETPENPVNKEERVDYGVNYWLTSSGVSIIQDMKLELDTGKEGTLSTGQASIGESWNVNDKYYLLKSMYDGKHIVSFIPPEQYRDKYSEYPACNIRKSRVIMACIESASKVPVFNIEKNNIEDNGVVYKLAIGVGDNAAPAAIDFDIHYDKNAGSSVVIEFDKSKAGDAAKYLVYYSKNDFKEISSSLKKIDIDFIQKKLIAGDTEKSLDIVNVQGPCSFDYDNAKKQYEYKGSSSEYYLDKDKVYHVYSTSRDLYAILITGLDADSLGQAYYFTVIAEDDSGNKLESVKTDKVDIASSVLP